MAAYSPGPPAGPPPGAPPGYAPTSTGGPPSGPPPGAPPGGPPSGPPPGAPRGVGGPPSGPPPGAPTTTTTTATTSIPAYIPGAGGPSSAPPSAPAAYPYPTSPPVNHTPPSIGSSPHPSTVPQPYVAPPPITSASTEHVAEVTLGTMREKEKYENMAVLYSIIKTVEHLDKAYIRDSVSATDYTSECNKLISQFKAAESMMGPTFDVAKFMSEYKMNCPAAYSRLVVMGVPATVEFGGDKAGSANSALAMAETVQYFITAMDSLKLDMRAKDEVQPLISDLLKGLNAVSSLAPDWEGKVVVKKWLVTLNAMSASDELDDTQHRQLLFDLETHYDAFFSVLQQK